MNREMRKEIRRAIAHVEDVLRTWDPIGVLPGPGDDMGPMDEYDSYAPHILSLLISGADVPVVYEELVRIRVEAMELKPDPPLDLRIAGELVTWWTSDK